jgi:hypothetical protein
MSPYAPYLRGQTNNPPFESVLVCESVLNENGLRSAIRIMDVLTIAPNSQHAHFFVLTYLHCNNGGDLSPHIVKVQMIAWNVSYPGGVIVAEAPDQRFTYGYLYSSSAPGGFALTTEFTLDLAPLGQLGSYYIQALVDGVIIQQTPLTLRRRS